MKEQYIILKNIRISNANAISGFTYGFPAITHFLGYIHALSRKLQLSHGICLDGVGIVCHHHQVHAYRNSNYEPYSFALTRNPLTKEGKTAPINQEGRMHLTVSLVIKTSGINTVNDAAQQADCQAVKLLAEKHKLAGGRVISIDSCKLAKTNNHKVILRSLLPGFVLIDRSSLLADKNEHHDDVLTNWLDFSALKYVATDEPITNKEGKVKWQQIAKTKGYTVPIQIGYKQIMPTYKAGEVANVRDQQTPVSFVEAVHSIGEWVGSPSKLESLQQIIWQHHHHQPFYVCHSQSEIKGETYQEDEEFDLDII